MFERKIYDEMLKWKREYAPKYALFLGKVQYIVAK